MPFRGFEIGNMGRGGRPSKFRKRVTLLVSHIFDTDNFPNAVPRDPNTRSDVHLNTFVDWAINIVDWDIPKELETLVVAEDLPKETKPKEAEQEETRQEEIHALFDTKTREGIIKLFPLVTDEKVSREKWNKLFDKASRNGLINAREEGATGIYNLAKVAEWLVKKDLYTQQYVDRKLVNNLPPRSKDKKYLITGELD